MKIKKSFSFCGARNYLKILCVFASCIPTLHSVEVENDLKTSSAQEFTLSDQLDGEKEDNLVENLEVVFASEDGENSASDIEVFLMEHPGAGLVDPSEAICNLENIHSRLRLVHGSFEDEYPEQLMTSRYLSADAKVLELGGNWGRNSCVIAAILENSQNLVVLETDKRSADSLRQNRDVNGFQFHIETSALSKIPLIQSGWDSMPSEVDLPGYFRVDTINFDDLQKKYDIEFDTMVVDCEGALYYILRDDPEVLKNIKLMIVENDYVNRAHYDFIVELFKSNGFELVYSEVLTINNRAFDSVRNDFYQVWKR